MTSADLLAAIQTSDEVPKPVPLPYVIEAINQLTLYVDNVYDVTYMLACLNLLNRYVKEDREERHVTKRDLYMFKRRVSQVLEVVVSRQYGGAEVWIAKDVTYASLFGVQFSFHNLPPRRGLLDYANSPRNRVLPWSGFRLQPRSALVLDWARQLRAEYYIARPR